MRQEEGGGREGRERREGGGREGREERREGEGREEGEKGGRRERREGGGREGREEGEKGGRREGEKGGRRERGRREGREEGEKGGRRGKWEGGRNTAKMAQKFCKEVIACERFHVLFLLPRLSPLPSVSLLPPDFSTHSTLYWTALSRNGDTIWNMSLSDTSNTRPLSIPGTRKISKLTFEPLGKSLYWINKMNATIERYDLRTGQLRTIAEYAADVTGTTVYHF